MGCDIHYVIEKFNGVEWVKVELNWKRHRRIMDGLNYRDYELFSVLANIRNQRDIPLPYICFPKGEPEGRNYFENSEEDYYYHSHSYLLFSEIFDFKLWPKERRFAFVETLKRISRNNANLYRLIFAFDN